jgi:hypothetical protein
MKTILIATYIKHRVKNAYFSLNDEQKDMLLLGTKQVVTDVDINEEIRFVPTSWGWIAYYEGTYGHWMAEKDWENERIKNIKPQNNIALNYQKNKHTVTTN